MHHPCASSTLTVQVAFNRIAFGHGRPPNLDRRLGLLVLSLGLVGELDLSGTIVLQDLEARVAYEVA